MNRQLLPFLIFIGFLLEMGCSPKVQDTATPEPPKVEEVKELDPNGCIKFNDLTAEESRVASRNYNLYRDQIKVKNFDEAYPLWKVVYKTAPSTNGKIDYVFRDGIKIYTSKIENTTDTILQKKYVDSMMTIYDKAVICFPNKKSYYLSKRGADLFYKYKGAASDEEIYRMLKTAVEADGNESRVRPIIPLSSLNYSLFADGKISAEDARKTLENINNIVKYNSENCKGEKECTPWTQVEQYTVELSNRFENRKGFYSCDYFLDKYYSEFEADPKNCDVIEDLYRKLSRSGCAKEEPKMKALESAYRSDCVEGPGPLTICRNLLEAEKFSEAVDCYESFISTSSDNELNAKLWLRIAKIHYAHTRSFSKSRAAARKALKLKSNWGAPLILIGKLYASSGPLCGPGTGWKSQVVTWPAIDKWNEAKRKDPSSAAEANKLIRQYSKYMPNAGDIFSRTLKEGETFKVKCWIQETTKIRAAK